MWYVVQTVTGREQDLVEIIYKGVDHGVFDETFIFERKVIKRLGGKWVSLIEPLFPSYVFVETNTISKLYYELKKFSEFFRILGSREGEFIAVSEGEQKFLKTLCSGFSDRISGSRRRYLVELSKVVFDKNSVIIGFEGPLAFLENNILSINLRKRYALVEVEIGGKVRTVMMGVEV